MSDGKTVMRVEERAPTIVEQAMIEQIKTDAASLWDVFDALGSNRELSLAKTKLQEAVMWALQGATR